MTTIYYCCGRGRFASYEKVSVKDAAAKAANSLRVIRDLRTSIALAMSDSNHSNGFPFVREGNWTEFGYISIDTKRHYTVGVGQTKDMQNLDSRLSAFELINDTFINKCNNNITSIGDTYIDVIKATANEFDTATRLWIKTIIDGTDCAVCHAAVPTDEVQPHQKTYQCQIQAGKNQLTGDMVKIQRNGELATFIRKSSNIPSIMIPEMFGVYVPKWVSDAIDTYHKGGAYSDLSIEEYLMKLFPDEGQSAPSAGASAESVDLG